MWYLFRAQQSSERWQARFEEKCREVKKIETSLNFAKSAIARLEKEKRVLLNRATELKRKIIFGCFTVLTSVFDLDFLRLTKPFLYFCFSLLLHRSITSVTVSTFLSYVFKYIEILYSLLWIFKPLPNQYSIACQNNIFVMKNLSKKRPFKTKTRWKTILTGSKNKQTFKYVNNIITDDKHSEKQDHELSEKARSLSPEPELPSSRLPPHITTQSLLDRIEAQQRRIAALELAEKVSTLTWSSQPTPLDYQRHQQSLLSYEQRDILDVFLTTLPSIKNETLRYVW